MSWFNLERTVDKSLATRTSSVVIASPDFVNSSHPEPSPRVQAPFVMLAWRPVPFSIVRSRRSREGRG
jgi:hypothetical protein